MNEELKNKLKYLRLGGLIADWDSYMNLAQRANYSQVRLLTHIIEEEYKIKKENSRKIRLRRANIPQHFVIETYPFEKQPNLKKKKILNIYDSFDYMSKNQDIIWIGGPGVGKSGLATSFLIQAINKEYTGRFIVFPELVEILYQAVADHSEAAVLKTFASYDCLLIDELGYVEIEPIQVGLFFTLMKKRLGKKTTLITTNLGFSQWDSFLKNNHLTAALIDRLTESSYVFNMKKCRSLRDKLDND